MTAPLVCLLLVSLAAAAGNGPASRLRSLASPDVAVSSSPRAPSNRRRRRLVGEAAVSVPFALALELRAGRDLSAAFSAVADEHAGFGELADRLRIGSTAAATGGDLLTALCPEPVDLLRSALGVTAACCRAAQQSGMPLADLLDAASASARSQLSLQGLADSELAGARSTMMVLAALPMAGLGMGQLLGAHPLSVLLTTGWGCGCLALAAAISGLGLLWFRAITSSLRRAIS